MYHSDRQEYFLRSHLRQSKLFWFYHFFYLRHSRKNNERLRIRAVKLTVQFQLPEKPAIINICRWASHLKMITEFRTGSY